MFNTINTSKGLLCVFIMAIISAYVNTFTNHPIPDDTFDGFIHHFGNNLEYQYAHIDFPLEYMELYKSKTNKTKIKVNYTKELWFPINSYSLRNEGKFSKINKKLYMWTENSNDSNRRVITFRINNGKWRVFHDKSIRLNDDYESRIKDASIIASLFYMNMENAD